ncbi:cadmium resistance transporter [Micromonospora echinospora]|uniref:Cadmium resistance protein CadD (Predicted permease) n=1 Tax=Micromonospora echinospora TaxID=1877 RepID=A0ABR6MII9_MICEC|nr:cadmium resistance transporter [Micromonospora echinospora]MBB5115077.1 cadmium resistance protein CadD (predicted permease) [Micromonospora echinospora]
MIDVITAAVGAAGVFAATNLDDIVVLTVLFVAARHSGRPRPWQIVAGQYAGIGALVAIAVVAAAGLLVVPDPWPGLLGLLPIGLGIRALLSRADDDEPPPAVVGSLLGVAGVTVANGADNIAVYVPVFRSLDPATGLVWLLVFALLVAVWCAVAAALGGHPRVVALVGRAGHWLVPVIFIVIGATILLTSGVLPHLAALLT